MITIEQVAEKVSDVTGVSLKIMRMSKRNGMPVRDEMLTMARRACYHIMFNYIPYTTKSQIGRYFSRQHDTIISELKQAELMMHTGDTKILLTINQVVEQMGLSVIHKSQTHEGENLRLKEEIKRLNSQLFHLTHKRA